MHDQRKQPRVEENVTITFENATDAASVGRGLDEMPCLLTEISEGGARIRVHKALPVGTPLLLHVLLENEEDDEAEETYLRLHAETRWHPDADLEPPYEIGLEFDALDDETLAALREYIARKVTNAV